MEGGGSVPPVRRRRADRSEVLDRLWAMEVFVKVVEAHSLSRAAMQLDLANASVTACIRNLEAHLGVTLLQRNTRHLHLTDEGETFYNHCRSILAQVDAAEAAVVPSPARLKGTLRLEVPIAVGHLFIGPAMVEFAAEHPDLQVFVSLSNVVDSLIRRGVDLAIRMDEVDDGDLIARWVFEARHVLCASAAFLRRYGTPNHPRDIDPRRCLGFKASLASKIREWTFHREGDSHELHPTGNLCFNSTDALLQAAVSGGGMIYVLEVLARDYLQRGELVPLLPEWLTAKQTFYAVYPQSRFIPPKVRALVEFLGRVFQEPPKSDSVLVPPARLHGPGAVHPPVNSHERSTRKS